MLKICYLTYYTYPEVQGGAPLYTYKIANYFAKRNFDVLAIGRKRNGMCDEISFHNIQIKRIHNLRFNWTNYYRIIDKNFFFPLSIYKDVLKECKDANFFHIISSSLFFPTGYLVKKKFKIPIVVSIIEDLWTNLYGSFFADLYLMYQRWQLKMALKYADAVVVHSDYALERIKKNYPQYIQKVTKIYEGVDPLIVKQLEKQNNKHINNNEKIILVAGSLVKGKNLEVVLKAIKRLKDRGFKLKLLIIGDGPLRNHLKNLAKKLEIEKLVTFIGEVKHEEIAKFYNLADIIIQPSKGEGSQPPPSVIEYLASGKPVITSEACDMSGLLKDCALRFNPNDEDILSQEIEKLLTDKDLCEKIGKKGKETVCKRFSSEQFFREFERIYDYALRDNRR